MTDNNQEASDKILAKLDPKTRARFKDASSYEIERIKTPSLGMNIALRGGIPKGRLTTLWGNKSAGKSTLCYELVREVQEDGGVAAIIDAERTWDPSWAKRFGVDTKAILFSQSTSITKVTQDIVDLQKQGVDLIIADSITAMTPSVYYAEKGEDYKPVEDSKQIGAQAREFSIAIPMWIGSNEKTALVAISQARNKFGSMHASFIPSGGEAVGFYSSVMIKLWSSGAEGQAIKGEVHNGNLVFEEVVGRDVTWMIEKNKTGPQFQQGKYKFYFHGDKLGIDLVGETLEHAVKHGVIRKGGAWYTIEGQQFQGEKAAVQFLDDNPELVSELQATILGT